MNNLEEVTALKTVPAAKRISVAPATLRRLVARGLIKPNKLTRHWLFPIAELDRFLKEAAPDCEPAKAKSDSHSVRTLA